MHSNGRLKFHIVLLLFKNATYHVFMFTISINIFKVQTLFNMYDRFEIIFS